MQKWNRRNTGLFRTAGKVSAWPAAAVWLILLPSLAAAFGLGKPPAETRPE